MLRDDPAYAAKAARVSALATRHHRVSGDARPRAAGAPTGLTVAYHSACSLQHGQKITAAAEGLAGQAGLRRCKDIAEGASVLRLGRHLQHPAAGDRRRSCATARSRNIEATGADVDRHRQHRLHHADRVGHGDPGRAHGRAARLGDRRAEAGSN